MLVFIDESYKKPTDANPKSTFSAVTIEENRYCEFDRKFFALKKHFWKAEQPFEHEVKGRHLLTMRSLALPSKRAFLDEIIALCQETSIVPFAVTHDGTIQLARDSEYLPESYRAIIRRLNGFMANCHPSRRAKIYFDSIDEGANRKIAMSFNNFMYKHALGRKAQERIIPVAFFANSQRTPMLQVADVVAYCVNERYCGRRGELEDYFRKIRELTFNDSRSGVWGISAIKVRERPRE